MKKREELKIRFRALFWLLRAKSRLSLANKRLLYVTILRPIWMFGIPLWSSAANSNIQILQRFPNTILPRITGAPWYLTNQQIHHDMALETVMEIATRETTKYIKRLHNHPNTEALTLLEDPPIQRLKTKALANT